MDFSILPASSSTLNNNLFIDNDEYNFLVGDYSSTASLLNIADSSFVNSTASNGTEAMDLLIRQQKGIQEVSNLFQRHVIEGISTTLWDAQLNINNASVTSSNNMSLDDWISNNRN